MQTRGAWKRISWMWASCFAGVGGAVQLLSGDPLAAVAGGTLAASLAGLWSHLMLRPLRARIEVLTSASRLVQQQLDVQAEPDTEDPVRLARDTSAVVDSARDLTRQLSTLVAVMDGMTEGIWITDQTGTIVQHNNALKEMLYAGQELVGQRPVAFMRSAELQDAVLRACDEHASSRLELVTEGVLPRTLAVQVIPLGSQVGGSAAVFHDVTELRRLEKVRKDFVANVSHELRTPITAIRGYAETLRAGALSDANNAPQMVEIIHRQSERLSELVEDLLELSRIEAKQIQLESLPVDLKLVVTRAADAVRPKAASRGITLELSVPDQLTARGDPRAMEQVLINLLDNAVKYTTAQGAVQVSGAVEASQCLIHVRDNGIGIEPKHLSRVFERFYRVDKGRSRDMGGTGLGLSIVKHLCTAMKGDVRVHSQPGQGSTFTVVLPSASAG